jgi:hypothetical protein
MRWLALGAKRGPDLGPPGSPEWWDWWIGSFGPLFLFGVDVHIEPFSAEPDRDWDAALRDLLETRGPG